MKAKKIKVRLNKILKNAELDTEDLSDETLKDIKKARIEFRKGKSYTSKQISKEPGI